MALALCFMVVGWTMILVAWGPNFLTLWRLSRFSATTKGVVTSVDPRHHNRATYNYAVEGARYTNSEIASHRRPGEEVVVYYWPHDPSVSCLVAPGPALREDLLGIAILCAVVAGVSVVAGLRWWMTKAA